jgi:outer membrane biosynthesis protein TonB
MLLHSVLGFLILSPGEPPPQLPPIYKVELVAAPAPPPRPQRRRPEVEQRPAEQTVPTQPRPQQPQEPDPVPVEVEENTEPAPPTNPDTLPPDVEPSTGSDAATVNTIGVEFPFPEYLRNIVAQVHRRWQRPSGNVSLRAEVQFFIRADGSVSNFQFVTRSGNFGFDLEAQGAIEAAANAGAFGPLPEGFASGVLPVNFFFDPSERR